MSVKIDYQYPPIVGGAIGDIQSIANNAALTIRPRVGVTWFIERLTFSGAVTINRRDGTTTGVIVTEAAAGDLKDFNERITHDLWITMDNASGNPLVYSYSGYIVNSA